jgi:hypothetical protein
VKKIRIKILPKDMRNTTITMTLRGEVYQVERWFHPQIQIGYVLMRAGMKIVELGVRMMGVQWNEERE